uniref:Cytochrome c oxidase subunit 3 n=1 Tax=Geukensia demissa TaxID=27807 RepID=A0A6B9VPG9_GEUDE|nr:cytochrome c oxidase subunit III [Geukensia demissa]
MVRCPFFLVSPSPWPFMVSTCLTSMAIGLVNWMYRVYDGMYLICGSVVLLLCLLFFWWRDVLREGDQGYHSSLVMQSFRDGVFLFIVSEVMFFFSFFWAFFHSSLSPNVEVGGSWPPVGIRTPNVLSVPLLNTWLLLSSGAALNYSHLCLVMRDYDYNSIFGMFLSIIMGGLFVFLQYIEYYFNSFTIADGIYGSTFYMLTGFHGFHVIVGLSFMLVTFLRLWYGHFLSDRHFGFEACSWYWHFVDVVWIFLYIFVYVWGSGFLHDAYIFSDALF